MEDSFNADNILKIFDELVKTWVEKEKEKPCYEHIIFDKSAQDLSREQLCQLMLMLMNLFNKDCRDSLLIYYKKDKNEWRTLIGKDKIKKEKLSDICYHIGYDDCNGIFKEQTLYIRISSQIKECYKHEFEPQPIYLPYELDNKNIPTIGNYHSTNRIAKSKYALVDAGIVPEMNYVTFKIDCDNI